MRVPLFLSKFSRHDFTVHQHLLLLAFRELSHESWRGLHDRLEDSKAAEEVLLLSRIPHFTTPQKFLQRIPRRWLLRLLHALVALLTSELHLAADASPFPLRFASTHYLQRLGQTLEFRHFLKSIDAVDVSTGLVVTTRAVIGNRHEAPFTIPLLRQIPRHFHLRELYADKAFDSEAIYRYLGRRGVATYIPPRAYSTLHGWRRTRLAKFQRTHPDEWRAHYGRRARVESTYHALKARVGDRISGRGWPQRTRYHWMKVWAYDLHLFGRRSDGGGILALWLEEGFYITVGGKRLTGAVRRLRNGSTGEMPARDGQPHFLEPLLGVVFDLDGTLVLSHHDFGRMRADVIRLAEHYGVPPGRLSVQEPIHRIVEEAREELRTSGAPDGSIYRFEAEYHKRIDAIELEALPRTVARAGAADLLGALRARGFRLGLLTRSSETFAREALRRTGLAAYFTYLRSRSTPGPAKPSPESLLMLLKEMGVPIDRALFVGDHLIDAETATRARVRFYAILPDPSEPTSASMTEDRFLAAGAAAIAHDLAELRRHLDVNAPRAA